jgi:hypothetical protein
MWSLFLIGQLTHEWCIARLVVENGHQKDTCYEKIGLHCAQIVYIILGLLVSAIGKGLRECFEEKSNLRFGFLLVLHMCSGSETWYDIDRRDTHLFIG